MPRNRAGAQLAINAPPELLERLRAAAAARRQTVTAVVVEAIEAALSGGLQAAAAPAAGAQLLERVAALEAAVAQLQPRTVTVQTWKEEQEPRTVTVRHIENPEPGPPRPIAPLPASPERVEPIARTGEPEPLPVRRLTPAEAAGLLTTPEVGQALGLASDSALTNWIAREAAKRGGTAVGGIYRGHRLRGKGLLPGGQKPGWLWERVEA
jgi:hypothetical protein